MIKQVLPLFAVAVAIGWFMPVNEPAETPAVATEAALVEEPADQSEGDAEPADSIELIREADGHFYTDVEVNAGSIRFLVDTGATAVALTGDDARELGLQWSGDELSPVARGAGGMVMGKIVTLERMQLGDVQATNVRAAIIPEGLPVSLLGQTFLRQVSSVNISGDRMIIG
jgi:aspartyl protease family protein